MELEHLPPAIRRPHRPRQPAAAATEVTTPLDSEELALRELLIQLLITHGGNVSAVAKAMGKGRMQIHRWAKRFGIDLEAFRR